MRIATVSAVLLVLLFWPGVAAAQSISADGLTANDVAAWLQGKGYPAEIGADNGKLRVRSKLGNTTFSVMLFDCNGDRCGSLQFYAGFQTHGRFDTSRMNEWNRNQRWARGYFDASNDPWLEMDVDLTPGGTYELLNDEFATWKKVLTTFITNYSLQ
jgi:hypothetical protein